MIDIAGAIIGFVICWRMAARRRRRHHEPCAEKLLDLPPPAPLRWSEEYMLGHAKMDGTCAHCGGTWHACAEAFCPSRARAAARPWDTGHRLVAARAQRLLSDIDREIADPTKVTPVRMPIAGPGRSRS